MVGEPKDTWHDYKMLDLPETCTFSLKGSFLAWINKPEGKNLEAILKLCGNIHARTTNNTSTTDDNICLVGRFSRWKVSLEIIYRTNLRSCFVVLPPPQRKIEIPLTSEQAHGLLMMSRLGCRFKRYTFSIHCAPIKLPLQNYTNCGLNKMPTFN